MSRLFVSEELGLAISVIKSGLAILQETTAARTNAFLFMLALSTGIERLMKILLCLRSLDEEGRFLTEQELRAFGHNLVRLNEAVVDQCFTQEALRRPALQEDFDFIRNDPLLQEVLQVLSDFALRDRYVYMDAINDPNGFSGWLEDRWSTIERMTMPADEINEMLMQRRLREVISTATQSIVICLERFLRALARTVTLSGLSPEARSMGTAVWDFLMLRDEELGQNIYEV